MERQLIFGLGKNMTFIDCQFKVVFFLMLFLLCSSCVSSSNRFVNPAYEPIVLDFPFVADYPIAQELQYIYNDTWQIRGDKTTVRLVKDGRSTENVQASYNEALLNADVTAGTNWSDIHQSRSDYYKSIGRGDLAEVSSQASSNAMMIEGSFQRAISTAQFGFAVYGAAMQFAAAVAKQTTIDTGNTVADYVRNTIGAIGIAAPTGSKLELSLSNYYQYLGNQELPSVDRFSEFVAIVTLDDGNGRIIRSSRSYRVYSKKGSVQQGNIPQDMSHLFFLGNGYVPLNSDKEFSTTKVTTTELFDDVGTNLWAPELILVTNSAIKDLYNKLAALKELE